MVKALTPDLVIARSKTDNLYLVKNLNLWGNDLEDIRLLRQMPNVEVLSLSVNKISSLKEFANCPKLQELYLRKNNINDLSEIRYLTNLPSLRVLWLWDNPCAEIENYREIVIKVLPNLVKLDNNAITPEEKMASAKLDLDIDEFKGGSGKEEPVESPPTMDRRPGQQVDYASNNPIGRNAGFDPNPRDYMSHQPSIESRDMGVYARKDSRLQEQARNNENVRVGQNLNQNGGQKERPLQKQTSYPNPVYESQSPIKQVQENVLYGDPVSNQNVGYKGSAQNDNVLGAVLLLIKDMDRDTLDIIRKEVEKKLGSLKIRDR